MNKSILCGNLCKDIDLRVTTNGKYVIQNTIAVKNDFKNANGEYDSTFINIVVWGTTAEYLSKYAEKGSKILLEGRISNRSYDKQDGTKAYITEVITEKVELLTFKKDEKKSINDMTSSEILKEVVTKEDPFKEFGEQISLNDDDLPF